ncbi:hypothetical protein [Hoylesella enoeca]|uniref:Fibrobacter succinogenes major paralogous domain-containing protein n=1 Tax=Hoylesella enoeca TaxID=76123 RepID=A0A0S2KKF3_9BACT|nr:hypothetical protein [Hoylesella enoeca]ALO48785.1 hypothetical protein AS203_06600 [Hoylesella enoeca]
MNKTKLIWAAVLLFTASCANEDVSKETESGSQNNQVLTTFTSGDEPATRTSMDHEMGSKGKFFWTTGDKIWIDNGTTPLPASTSSSITGKTDYAKFYVSGTFPNNSYPVYYTGSNGTSGKEVTIAANQTQSSPNNTDHFATSGDCGTATATGNGSEFAFKLKHQAAYLCLLPRSSSAYIHRSKLTKIEIVSEDDIAGTYTIATNGSLTLASGGSKTITLTTGSGWDVDNTVTDQSKNAAYVVVAPGIHAMRIRYWFANTVDGGHYNYYTGLVETTTGTVTKYLTINCEAGKIHDITSNLEIKDYSNYHDKYYMWDAKQNYWWQHEWNAANPSDPNIWQPITETPAGGNPNYPKSTAADPDRYYNEFYPGSGMQIDATNSCTICPNVNEMLWYAQRGNPNWDNELWTLMGHLYSGGTWFKKKAIIAAENSTTTTAMANAAPDGTDYRSTDIVHFGRQSKILPRISELSNYFYRPALGEYLSGKFINAGQSGEYWSSNGSPSVVGRYYAYFMSFTERDMSVFAANCQRNYGFQVQAFE